MTNAIKIYHGYDKNLEITPPISGNDTPSQPILFYPIEFSFSQILGPTTVKGTVSSFVATNDKITHAHYKILFSSDVDSSITLLIIGKCYHNELVILKSVEVTRLDITDPGQPSYYLGTSIIEDVSYLKEFGVILNSSPSQNIIVFGG